MENADEKYQQAVGLIILSQRASTSYLQRKLGIGYNAARDLMERAQADGIVSKPSDVGKREVLISLKPTAIPENRWHEDDGPVSWWKFPISEAAWIGTPLDSDWPGYHTHWTPHPTAPADPT